MMKENFPPGRLEEKIQDIERRLEDCSANIDVCNQSLENITARIANAENRISQSNQYEIDQESIAGMEKEKQYIEARLRTLREEEVKLKFKLEISRTSLQKANRILEDFETDGSKPN